MSFHVRLKKARQDKDLSQVEIAEALGVAKSTYSQYESGVRKPNYDVLKKISGVLDVSIDHLLENVVTGETQLRSAARLGTYDIDENEDRQIAAYIDFLVSQRERGLS